MTAEIGILNRQGVALAADSAVTISVNGKEKISNSANKLFNLIKGKPVGFMVYGNGSFMGLPWDVIVNSYRNNFDNTNSYPSLQLICTTFLNELSVNNKFYDKASCTELIYSKLSTCLENIIIESQNILSEKYKNIQVDETQVLEIFEEVLNEYISNFSNKEYSDGFTENDYQYIYSNCNEIVLQVCSNHIKFKLSSDKVEKIKILTSLLMTRNILYNYSGIVIAGYGDDEILPSLYHYRIEGIVNNKLKYTIEKTNKIIQSEFDNGVTAEIVPFAQQEMVHSILTGMDPYLKDFIFDNISHGFDTIANTFNSDNPYVNAQIKQILNREVDTIKNSILNYQQNYFIHPILSMVAMLNKDELATMAENLVNITSFKRKFTTDTETVGGPIDVAVISKSDGFIWIKRKHYFKPELNHTYFNNNY